jgi:hypothetical protein
MRVADLWQSRTVAVDFFEWPHVTMDYYEIKSTNSEELAGSFTTLLQLEIRLLYTQQQFKSTFPFTPTPGNCRFLHHVSPSSVSDNLPKSETRAQLTLPLVISLCAANKRVSLSAGSAINAMENAPYATAMYDPQPWYASATNAPLATIRTNASFVEAKGSPTPFTASNAHAWKKIETVVQRLSISEVQGRISSTRKRILGINNETGSCYRAIRRHA